MSLDIVEIALSCMTDHVAFEALAAELMRDEGYPRIQPLGGAGDLGRDAVEETFFSDGDAHVTVFQFTLQDYLSGKLVDTIVKLRKNDITFHELVVVTPHSISTELQDKLIRLARKNYQVSLRIFERKTILNRLSDYSNGLFHRYFPDVKQQLADLLTAKERKSVSKNREAEILRISTVFTFSREGRRARKSVFDNIILSLLLTTETASATVEEVVKLFAEQFGGRVIPVDQVRASVERMDKAGLIDYSDGSVKATDEAIRSIEGGVIRADERTDALLSDIVESVGANIDRRLSRKELHQVRENARSMLVDLFRLFGIELSNQIVRKEGRGSVYLEFTGALSDAASKNLSAELGELLIAAVGQVLKAPTEEQAEVLEAWALAYLGATIMNLDPTLGEFQATRLRGKIFIVDTDVILDAAVTELPTSLPLRGLLETLLRLGCRVVVTDECIRECVTHASIAYNTFNYFGESLTLLNDAAVDERVNNVFVKGYYYGRTRGSLRPAVNFSGYLGNYLEGRSGAAFFRQVVQENLPDGVEIVSVEDLNRVPLSENAVARLAQALFERMQGNRKSAYRTESEMKTIARNDAINFLTAYNLNPDGETGRNSVLGGTAYLVTNSSRFLRAAPRAGLNDFVTTRPQILLGLLDLLGHAPVSAESFVGLFENPFLIHAVSQAWNDLDGLVRAGVELTGKSLPRLRWDLDSALHESIAAVTAGGGEVDDDAASEVSDSSPAAGDDEYISLLQNAARRGYRLIPEASALVAAVEKSRDAASNESAAYQELLQEYQKLETAIGTFGKSKQKYLRKLVRRKELGT